MTHNIDSFKENDENRFGTLLLLSSSIRELALNIRETLFASNCSDPLGIKLFYYFLINYI